MKIAPVADVKARLSAYLEMCAEEPIIVTKNGRPKAVLVAVSDQDELEHLVLAHTPRFMAILDAAARRIKKGKGIKHEHFWKLVSKKS
jgi:prevent-host-death family protein